MSDIIYLVRDKKTGNFSTRTNSSLTISMSPDIYRAKKWPSITKVKAAIKYYLTSQQRRCTWVEKQITLLEEKKRKSGINNYQETNLQSYKRSLLKHQQNKIYFDQNFEVVPTKLDLQAGQAIEDILKLEDDKKPQKKKMSRPPTLAEDIIDGI